MNDEPMSEYTVCNCGHELVEHSVMVIVYSRWVRVVLVCGACGGRCRPKRPSGVKRGSRKAVEA
jgi:transcription elongation factor Elf1